MNGVFISLSLSLSDNQQGYYVTNRHTGYTEWICWTKDDSCPRQDRARQIKISSYYPEQQEI